MCFASDHSLFFRHFSVCPLDANLNVEGVHNGEEGGIDKLNMGLSKFSEMAPNSDYW